MSDWTDNQDPYQVLGLTQGHETTEAELKKVAFPANRAYTVCLVTNARCNAGVSSFSAEKASRQAKE